MRPLHCCSETSGTSQPVKGRYIAAELRLQLHSCESLESLVGLVCACPAEHFVWHRHLEQNLICIRAMWNAVHRMKSEYVAYTYNCMYNLTCVVFYL